MNANEEFANEVKQNIQKLSKDADFRGLSNVWLREAGRASYFYNFSWLGRPIIQVPQDIYAIQELVWQVKPDLIIETGIAHGGSLILSASLLAMLDYVDAVATKMSIDPLQSKRRVIGIDIEIRSHNRKAISEHPMAHLIDLHEGSSIDTAITDKVRAQASQYSKVLVMLDSNHTHAHVLEELKLYAPMVSQGSYCVVMDSSIDNLPEGHITNRPWGKGNNPKTALFAYLDALKTGSGQIGDDGKSLEFDIDKDIESKLMVSGALDGFLRRRVIP
jgi:cephalosporin hydroxylase